MKLFSSLKANVSFLIISKLVEGGAQGLAAGGGDDGVGLGVDGAAQLVPLPGWDVQRLAGAVVQIHAVAPPAGGAVVASGDDLVALDENGPIAPAQAGGAPGHRLGDVQIVILLVDASHKRPSHAFLPVYRVFRRPASPGMAVPGGQFTYCLRFLP